MTYAATYRIGYNPATPRAEAKAVAPPVKRLRRLDGADKGCKRNPKGQTAIRTDSHAANGFLRTSFLPRLHETETVQACGDTAKTERDFYKSLSHLAKHYGIRPMQTRSYGYPYNMALALWHVHTKLKKTVRNWEGIRLVKDGRKTYLISEERYSTGTTLYYIPVLPLFLMLKDPKRKRNAHLLLSVFTYLYHHADIPYHRQQNSYLYWQYEMLLEWVEQDEQTDETEAHISEMRQAEWIGDHMEQKLFNRANLEVFGQRLDGFVCNDEFDCDCLKLARKAYALYGQYPNESIFRHAKQVVQEDDDRYYDDGVLAIDRFISFFHNGEGWLYDNLSEMVNNEFNEYGEMQEPYILKRFDGSKVTEDNLDFEDRLVDLIDNLCYILNNYKRT